MGADLFVFTVTNFIWDNSSSHKLSKEYVKLWRDQKHFCVLFASIRRKLEPSFKFLAMLIFLMALKTREGIFFFLKKSNEAENFSGFNEEAEQERRCDIMKYKILAALQFVGFVVSHKSWICYCTQICNLPTLLTLQPQESISLVWYPLN